MAAESAQESRAPGELIHEILPVGLLQCNCHIVGDQVTRDAIVIDPGDEVERILAVIRRDRLNVRAILNTHAHIDHVGGLKKMREATGAPVLMHEADLELYHNLEMQAQLIGFKAPQAGEVDEFLREGHGVRWADYELRVLHTPGHTKGSVCLYLPRAAGRPQIGPAGTLFAGDTLFAGSIGRTDLWGGSFGDIMHSIQEKLLTLPDDVVVFPGHGPATTIGEERETNPFLRGM